MERQDRWSLGSSEDGRRAHARTTVRQKAGSCPAIGVRLTLPSILRSPYGLPAGIWTDCPRSGDAPRNRSANAKMIRCLPQGRRGYPLPSKQDVSNLNLVSRLKLSQTALQSPSPHKAGTSLRQSSHGRHPCGAASGHRAGYMATSRDEGVMGLALTP